MRKVVSYMLFPAILTFAMVAGAALLSNGVPPGWVVAGLVAVCAVPIVLAQRWMPYETSWQSGAKVYGLDLVHMAMTGVAGESARALVLGAVVWMSVSAADHVGFGLWPSHAPLAAQVVLALVAGDFGAYWVHRLSHRLPLLWRIHAMHHTSERLYVLSSGRNHPMNVVLTYTCQVGPLLALGAGGDVLALVALFTSVHGMLQHANIDMRHGVLNHVFATAELHRWHHHTDHHVGNHNFGSNLVLFDQIFRTRYLPANEHPREVGIPELKLPAHVLHHLALPFRIHRYAVVRDDAA